MDLPFLRRVSWIWVLHMLGECSSHWSAVWRWWGREGRQLHSLLESFSQLYLWRKQLALNPQKKKISSLQPVCGQNEGAPLQRWCKGSGCQACHAAATVAAFAGKSWHDSDAALSHTASKRCRQKVCPLGSTKILPELDMRWVWRKGRFPCFMLKQHTYSQASMFTVFIAALGLNRSQSHLEGSWVWGGLWVVIPTSVTICVKMSACAEIQLGYKHS